MSALTFKSTDRSDNYSTALDRHQGSPAGRAPTRAAFKPSFPSFKPPSPGVSLKERIGQLQRVRDELDHLGLHPSKEGSAAGSSSMSPSRRGTAQTAARSHAVGARRDQLVGEKEVEAAKVLDSKELTLLMSRVAEEDRRGAAGLPRRLGSERRRVGELEAEVRYIQLLELEAEVRSSRQGRDGRHGRRLL
jgi:hypothetical protein